MSKAPTGAGSPAPRLTGDEYMALLLDRQAAYCAEHPPEPPWLVPLLEWFVRDGDEDLFTPPKSAPQHKPERRPRNHKPASHWRDRLQRIDAELAALGMFRRHDTDDMAAYGGVGIRETPRQRDKYWARFNRTAKRYGELSSQRDEIAGKLARAEQREAS